MLSFLFDLSWLYDLLILIICLILLIIFIKSETFRIILGVVIASIYLLFTAWCGVQINNYYSATGGIYGELQNFIKPNNVLVNNLVFTFDNLVLTETGKENEYGLSISTSDILDLTENVNYCIFVNGTPTSYIKSSTEFIIANYDYVFYDEDLNIKFKDTLTLKFSFYENSTLVIVTTQGGLEAVNYWNYYFNKNNFKVEIKEINGVVNNDLNSSEQLEEFLNKNFNNFNFYVDGVLYKNYLVFKNDKLNDFPIPTKDGYIFKGWSLSPTSFDLIDFETFEFKENTNFYAVYEIEKCLVSFYDVDGATLLGTRLVEYGTIIDESDEEFLTSGPYRWQYLNGSGSETFGGVYVTGNCSLQMYKYAHIG